MTDEPADPYLRALLGIGAELTQIRLELQKLNAPRETGDDSPTHECRCGATFGDMDTARDHVRDKHNAPPGATDDLLQTND